MCQGTLEVVLVCPHPIVILGLRCCRETVETMEAIPGPNECESDCTNEGSTKWRRLKHQETFCFPRRFHLNDTPTKVSGHEYECTIQQKPRSITCSFKRPSRKHSSCPIMWNGLNCTKPSRSRPNAWSDRPRPP